MNLEIIRTVRFIRPSLLEDVQLDTNITTLNLLLGQPRNLSALAASAANVWVVRGPQDQGEHANPSFGPIGSKIFSIGHSDQDPELRHEMAVKAYQSQYPIVMVSHAAPTASGCDVPDPGAPEQKLMHALSQIRHPYIWVHAGGSNGTGRHGHTNFRGMNAGQSWALDLAKLHVGT